MKQPIPRPLLLDLFCCAGGAARGYYDAGFDVLGVDIEPQPRYPYDFVQADAIRFLDDLLTYGSVTVVVDGAFWRTHLRDIDAVHASPPCQGYSVTKSVNPYASKYPRLIGPIRDRLIASGRPWVIENVEGAKSEMRDPVTLCGSQFGLDGIRSGHRVYLRRHRLFEANFEIPGAGEHNHSGRAFPVFGNGVGGKKWPDYLKGPGTADFAKQIMGIDWARREEVDQSIPPAYTRYVGRYLMAAVKRHQCRDREEAA